MSDGVELADILDRAATLLEPEGAWIQGRLNNEYETDDGSPTCFCLVGAIIEAARDNDYLASAARDAVAHVLGFQSDNAPAMGDANPPVVRWNDAEGRTQSEVIAKLREAASKARQQVKP
jgi:hypothetical protein